MGKRHLTLSGRIVTVLALGIFAFTAIADDTIAVVSTTTGPVQGSAEHGISCWTGIPYAKAPEGKLRWMAPVPPTTWSAAYDATRPAKMCLQVSSEGVVGQEDCLNLNIYRPTGMPGKLPVLVYIHGGNNQLGNSTEFTPSYLAGRLNAVIVTLNYRLGALGFNPLKVLNTGDPEQSSGNFALLDQRLALMWIRNNIDAFGGNSHNITVSGFSGGGRDVMAMLISPLFANTFDKAIVFSGGMTTADKNDAESIFARQLAPLVVKKGIKKDIPSAEQWLLTPSAKVKAFLYRLPAVQLAALFGDAGIRMKRFPHLYRDGVVLPASGFTTATYNAVPLIMITGQQEFSFFARRDAMFTAAVKKGTLATNTVLLNKYNFASKYGGLMYSLFNVDASAAKMYKSYNAPIYGMEFRYGSDAFVTGDKLAQIGSFHGVFMPFWDSSKYAEFTQDALKLEGTRQLGEAFNNYLKHFIESGSPNSRTQVTWQRWTPENGAAGQSLLIMDANKQKPIIYMSNKSYSYADIIREMDRDNMLSAKEKSQIMKQVLNGRWFSEALDTELRRRDVK